MGKMDIFSDLPADSKKLIGKLYKLPIQNAQKINILFVDFHKEKCYLIYCQRRMPQMVWKQV